MIITPINNILNKNQKTQTSFGHGNESFWKSDYSKKEKAHQHFATDANAPRSFG